MQISSYRKTVMSATCVAVSTLMLSAAVTAQAAIQMPTELTGCVLWLDGSDAASITEVGTGVSEWRDKSGGGAHVIQADSAKRPVSDTTTLNGKNTLSFDGESWLAGPAVLAEGDDTFAFFAVWRRTTTGGAQAVVEQAAASTTAGTRASLLTSGEKYGFNGQGNDQHYMAPFKSGEWKISGLEVDGRATRNVVLYDNVDFFAGTINIETQHVGVAGLCVGAKFQNKAERLNGEIAEIIVFDRILSDTDRNAVLYYLQQKWGVECGVQDLALLIDFEHDRLPDGWVANGVAFESQPVCSSRQAFNRRGDWMVGTYENDKNNGTSRIYDKAIGTLTGTSFTLANNTIRARIGGGYHVGAGKECQLQLQRESAPDVWQVIRKATGPNAETMREICWNVNNLIGETVRFRMVDWNEGSWGHVSVDDIRMLDEPLPRAISTDFTGTELSPELFVQLPVNSPEVGVTGTGTVRFALLHGTHDIWENYNRGPKLLINTIDDDVFTLETHLIANSFTNTKSQAGLILVFEADNANTFDPIMFGAYNHGGIRIEGPGITNAFSVLSGTVEDVYLKIEGRRDRFTFSYSMDGTTWETVRTDNWPGKVLMQAGLFCKDWSVPSALVAEFDYLKYTAEPILPGTVISIR